MKLLSNRKKVALVMLSVMCGSLWVNSAAAVDSQTKSMRISYADLDITKSPGQKVLYLRMEKAAISVCGPLGLSEALLTMPSLRR